MVAKKEKKDRKEKKGEKKEDIFVLLPFMNINMVVMWIDGGWAMEFGRGST